VPPDGLEDLLCRMATECVDYTGDHFSGPGPHRLEHVLYPFYEHSEEESDAPEDKFCWARGVRAGGIGGC
jgi:hypothetical protein